MQGRRTLTVGGLLGLTPGDKPAPVSVLTTQHPVALAEQAALLDQVSGGSCWAWAGAAPRAARDPGGLCRAAVPPPPGRHGRHCAASMAATIERTGIGHLLCMVEGGGHPERTVDNIARLGAAVLPALRERFGGVAGHEQAAATAPGPRTKSGST